ncbi:MAG: methyl-accepting chemotaxis protein [Methylocystis sp.]|uniref:methyl-accepting chemotaxis protein n=1 Tax=Methylocystis sp. TaxID=1911079 RepID=UPI003DA44B30
MNRLLNIPIGRKLTLITVLASAIALLLAGVIIVAYDSVAYRTQQRQDVAVRANIVASNVSAALVFGDPKAAQEYLQALRSNPDIKAAAVYTDQGELFTQYLSADTSTPPPPRALPQGTLFRNNELTIFWPIMEKMHQVGMVYMRVQTEPLINRVVRYGSIILLVMLGSLAITLPVSRRLHAVIVEPLRDMTEDARQIAAGEIVVRPIKQPRHDEIGFLEDKFREMAASLHEKATIGRQIAQGDLNLKITPQSDRDALGNTFVAMVDSLRAKAEVAGKIAAGDLTVQIAAPSGHDVLGQAFASMVENLRAINRELAEGVGVLAASTSAIMTGTSQIAAGATETATIVAQTVSTVDEMKQTVQLSSQKARHVSDTAQKAVAISQTGRKSVEDVIDGMSLIQQQMESIAQSIVRLSEQSQAIGEIVATVKDLAEQSNLLAVNAAIEANKAGEHGRGFSVVAQEVRNLAEQSKRATAQIRSLLGDIQKGTNIAVLATEQGAKAVANGVQQSREAGEAILQLAESIGENAAAANQIAVSAQQQMVGMDQLALATANIRETTSQNMESTRQAEVAAHSLHALGIRLKQLVERYKV